MFILRLKYHERKEVTKDEKIPSECEFSNVAEDKEAFIAVIEKMRKTIVWKRPKVS